MAPPQVFIAVIGLGGVSKAFISQLELLTQRTTTPKLNLILLARSSKIAYSTDYAPLPLTTPEATIANSTQPMLSIPSIITYLKSAPGPSILVDNTSSIDLASAYPSILSSGISIVTPNKKAFSASLPLFRDIFAAAQAGKAYIFHESSVGAGLPIISTLNELLATGDSITRIEGVFSGTMSFLFNSFAPLAGSGGKWSAEVANAKKLGYTEPDPRDDLNGVDVARKLVILARLCGLEVEGVEAFPVQSLIPKALETCESGEEFMERLDEFDGEMEEVKREAEAEGKVVRFVGSIDVAGKSVKVGLEKFERSSAIAGLKGSDNIISFYTKRYGSNPLIIQGAGAGGEVTAMGVTGDLLKVLARL